MLRGGRKAMVVGGGCTFLQPFTYANHGMESDTFFCTEEAATCVSVAKIEAGRKGNEGSM